MESRTEYEYDADGRLVRSRIFHESTVTPEDQAEMLALVMHEQSLCPCGCGYPRSIAWHDDNDGYFETGEPIICYARRVLDEWDADTPREQRPPGLVAPRLEYTRPVGKPLPGVDV